MGKQKKPKKRGKQQRNKSRAPHARSAQSEAEATRGDHRSTLRAEIQMALMLGRMRRAVGLARKLGEEDGLGDTDINLIAHTYIQHLDELIERGHTTKAAQTFARIDTDHPEWRSHFPVPFRIKVELLGASATLLSSYESDAETRGILDRHVPAALGDVRVLARHPGLPDTHLLKQQAQAIHRAWEAVEAGAPEASDLLGEMKRAVGRRSPLVDWRLFVQAVAGFYAGRTEAAEEALARVSPDGAVAPMAGVLRELNAGRTPRDRGGRLVAAVMSGDPLQMRLAEIDALVAERKWKEVARALRRLPKEFEDLRDRPTLQRLLGAGFVAHAGKEDPLHMVEDGDLPLGGRESILTFMASMGFDEPDDWEYYFDTQGGELTPCERALVCDRIACRITDESASGLFFGEAPAGFKEAESWWQRSVKAQPLRSTFRSWHKAASGLGSMRAEKVMERWHKAFPDDEQPLRALVDSCRARGVFQKAAGYFRKLDDLAGGKPEVESLRAFIAADEIVRHLRAGRERRAREALESLRALERQAGESGKAGEAGGAGEAGEQDAFTSALRRVLAAILEIRGGRREEAFADLLSANHPLLIATIAAVCHERELREARAVVEAVRCQREDTEPMAADFHRLACVRDPIWGAQRTIMFAESVVASLGKTALASGALRECLEYVLRLDPELGAPAAFELANAITANGIRRRDALWPVFLCYRALVLHSRALRVDHRGLKQRRRRILRCLRLAWQSASEQGNSEFLRLVERMAEDVRVEFGRSEMKPLSDHLVDQIVELEGNLENDRMRRRKPLQPRQKSTGAAGGGRRRRRPAAPKDAPRDAPPDQPSLF